MKAQWLVVCLASTVMGQCNFYVTVTKTMAGETVTAVSATYSFVSATDAGRKVEVPLDVKVDPITYRRVDKEVAHFLDTTTKTDGNVKTFSGALKIDTVKCLNTMIVTYDAGAQEFLVPKFGLAV